MRARLTFVLIGTVALASLGPPHVAASDQQSAQRSVLRLSDLPDGWRTAKSDSDDKKSKCLDPSGVAKPSAKASREFAKGDSAEASASVGIFTTAAEATRAFTLMASDKTWSCLEGELKKAIPEIDTLEQGRILVPNVGAQAASGRELVFTVKNDVGSGYVHVLFARVGRGVAWFEDFDAYSPPLAIANERHCVRQMINRLSGRA